MHEDAFNQLVAYYIGDSMDMTQSFDFEDYEYTLETLPLYANFINNKIHFTIIMKLYNTANPTDVFQTDFTLLTTPSISTNKKDLIFSIDSINIGDDTTVTNDKVSTILALVGENEMIDGDRIVLKDFMDNFSNAAMSVQSVRVYGKYLRFVVEPTATNQQAFDDLQDAIDQALQTVLLDPTYSAMLDAYQDDPDNSEGILNAFNDLSPAEQA